jgi:transposase-like protein
MARFTETTTYEIHCPACDGDRVVKIGFQSGTQRYRCKSCRKDFRANGKAEGRRMESEVIGAAIRDFYMGMSYKQIAEAMADRHDIPEPSKATIYEWVRDYTDEARGLTADMKAQVGDEWVADEMAVKVAGRQMWNWNVMDTKTRFILATHLSRTRTKEEAIKTMEKAKAAAGKDPKTIKTDKLTSYRPAITKVFPDTLHIKSQGLTSSLNNNMSERLQGTYRSREKTLRGLDSVETGQRYLDGWTITYNHMRGHESLKNDTPGKRAKANPPFTEWSDVVKADAVSPQPVTAETRLADAPQLKSDAKPELKREPPQRSKRESVSRTPRPERLPATARPGKAATKVKGRTAKQHPAYKLRQRIRRSQRGGRR